MIHSLPITGIAHSLPVYSLPEGELANRLRDMERAFVRTTSSNPAILEVREMRFYFTRDAECLPVFVQDYSQSEAGAKAMADRFVRETYDASGIKPLIAEEIARLHPVTLSVRARTVGKTARMVGATADASRGAFKNWGEVRRHLLATYVVKTETRKTLPEDDREACYAISRSLARNADTQLDFIPTTQGVTDEEPAYA